MCVDVFQRLTTDVWRIVNSTYHDIYLSLERGIQSIGTYVKSLFYSSFVVNTILSTCIMCVLVGCRRHRC